MDLRAVSLISLMLVPLLACKPEDEKKKDPADTKDSAEDSGDTTADIDVCGTLSLPVRAFNPQSPAAFQRHQPAGDFSVPLRDGTTWTLSERWQGCESYLFIPHWWPISELDDASYWETGVENLIERSSRNTHYFFVVASNDSDDVEAYGAPMQDRIDEALASLDEDDAAWWDAHLHVVAAPLDEVGGLVQSMFSTNVSLFGWAIDREQKIRSLGYFAAVEAYSQALSNAGAWPWENRIYQAYAEAEYFNFEAERQARLDAVDATIVEVFGGDVIEEYEDGTLSLPDAATMAGFDTLEIDVLMECPDKNKQEISNCGAWDYLAHMYLYDEASKSWLEMGRFITTYHRESRWVVDASHALAWLQDGGDRTIRYSWAPSWNTQPTGVTLKVRLSNQGKGAAPREVVSLFTGGAFSSTYNDERPPVEVEIPADVKKVEIVSIITGHGMETQNCAEFCRHGHSFSIGEETWSTVFSEAGTQGGCEDTIATGTVPNQAGTWWYGRGGWCPGRRVDPIVADVTAAVTTGEVATVRYEATLNGGAPVDGAGNIVLSSWLVFHR